jgi:hypothetical protein
MTNIDAVLDLVHADTVQCGIAELPPYENEAANEGARFFLGLLWAFALEGLAFAWGALITFLALCFIQWIVGAS